MLFADERRTERSSRGRDESIFCRQGKLLISFTDQTISNFHLAKHKSTVPPQESAVYYLATEWLRAKVYPQT